MNVTGRSCSALGVPGLCVAELERCEPGLKHKGAAVVFQMGPLGAYQLLHWSHVGVVGNALNATICQRELQN